MPGAAAGTTLRGPGSPIREIIMQGTDSMQTGRQLALTMQQEFPQQD